MFKLIGIVLVIAGFGAGGILGARKMEKRVLELRNIRLALGFLEKEIAYNYTPLSRAMERTYKFSSAPISLIFQECSAILQDKAGVTASEAWSSAVKKVAPYLQLQPYDIELLLTAASQLGVSDVNEQRKFLVFIQEELKLQEKKAQDEAQSGQKLWSYGGFIIGATVVILLV